ncbi:MAG: SMP-30/gluconolactonase/LRE family protein [Promethearchaeota archaeon]
MSERIRKDTEVLLGGLKFPEGPRWHDGKLWFSDMDGKMVKTVDLDGNEEDIIEVQNMPSGLGWTPEPDSKLLIVSMLDRKLLKFDKDGLSEVADLMDLATFHCNDMVVDKNGNAYIGNFGFNINKQSPEFKTAELILVAPNGNAKIVAKDMAFPNGTVITPDDQTLIVGETYASKLTAFDILSDGTLYNRRIWATLSDNVVPDGICLDVEGGIWVASPTTAEVIRVLEGGKVTDRVKVSTNAYACMLGGENRKTLFICTSDSSRINGKIETARVDIPGDGLP